MNLLRHLYGIHSPTGNEWDMICFVKEYLKEHVPEAGVRMDRLGNLYITKGDPEGGYPTLACHLDQVQLLHSTDFEVVLDGDTLYGWSASRQEREGLGADDKNGLWICLCCLEQCLRLKVFMAIGEEKGCIGSNRAEMGFFSDSLFVLEPDCKGGEEAHTVLRGIPCASEEFIEELALPEHGYTLTEGKTSDILALTLNDIGVSCINLPAGYHNPHKDDEYTVFGELERCLDFVLDTIHRLDNRFPHRYVSQTQKHINHPRRLFVDMDGVLVDFDSGVRRLDAETRAAYAKSPDEAPGVFSLMAPMPGAIEALNRLADSFEVYILSTAPWKNPAAWADKVKWVQHHLGDRFTKRLILCHHKDFLRGDFLIDDRPGKNGADAFKGELIPFGTRAFTDWPAVEKYLLEYFHK